MYTGLLHLHSSLRYVILILLIIAIVQAFQGWLGRKDYLKSHDKMSLYTLIGVHTQLIIGLILYLMSPIVSEALADMGNAMKDANLRFWAVEHITLMLIGIIVITIGRSRAKKAQDPVIKHKRTAIFFLIGLILIIISIPWPFGSVARPWF